MTAGKARQKEEMSARSWGALSAVSKTGFFFPYISFLTQSRHVQCASQEGRRDGEMGWGALDE